MLQSPNANVDISTYVEIMNEFGFEIFGELDKGQDGSIGSEIPCWYMDKHAEEEERLVHNEEIQLARGGVHPSQQHDVERRVKEYRQRVNAIKESRPKLDGAQTDALAKIHKELSSAISRAMHTKKETTQKYADLPHEEAKRIDSPVIAVSKPVQRFVILCNGRIVDGHISRRDAERAWKFAARLLEDPKGTNTEALRRAS